MPQAVALGLGSDPTRPRKPGERSELRQPTTIEELGAMAYARDRAAAYIVWDPNGGEPCDARSRIARAPAGTPRPDG